MKTGTGNRGARARRPLIALVSSALTAGLLVVPLATSASAAGLAEADFGFSAGYQTWPVPTGVHTATIGVIGGAGGDGAVVDSTCSGTSAGAGGWVEGTVPVTPGQVLSIWVGGGGHLSGAGGTGTPDAKFGGGPGGAALSSLTGNGGGGGAASVVWSGTGHQQSDILLVGSGGGGGGGEGPVIYECGGHGGNGGNPAAYGLDAAGVGGLGTGGIPNKPDPGGYAGWPGETPPSTFWVGAGGGGGGAGFDRCNGGGVCGTGGGGKIDPGSSGVAGGGAGGTSYAADGVTNTFFSSSGAHGSNGSVTITWGAPSSTSIASGVADVGASVSLHAFVEPADGGGAVQFASDGVTIPGCDAVGFTSGGGDAWEATCTTAALPAGVHEITATYSGDDAYAGSAASGFWTIRQPTTTSVTVPSGLHPGDALAIDAVVDHADGGGAVQFRMDGSPIGACNAVPLQRTSGTYHATCTTTAPAVGTYALGAVFSGDSIDYASTGSAALTVVAVTTVPGAPSIGAVLPGDASAEVNFSAPRSDGGSPITGYVAVATPVGGGASVTGTGTTDPFTLTGLANRTTYTVTVAATNALGTGPASTSSHPFTPIAQLQITTGYRLPRATVGKAYRTTLLATGGTGDAVWSLAPGSSLPAGLTLHAGGTISGTPRAAVSGWQFAVQAADPSSGVITEAVFALTVAPPRAADLAIDLTHAGRLARRGTGTYAISVANTGTLHTNGRVTATLTLPSGLSPVSEHGLKWTCAAHGRVVTCSRSSFIYANAVSTIHVTVRITAARGRRLTAAARVAPADATPGDNRATDTVRIS
jgi:hypothetical protein